MGHLLMSKKERERKALLEMVKMKKITLIDASTRMGISYRQSIRIYKRYNLQGDIGLLHKNRGKSSNKKLPDQTKKQIIDYYIHYLEGFGPTFAAEKLKAVDYEIDHETLRLLLIKEGLWKKIRKRKQYRSKRERKKYFGELVQMDGSHHDWFSNDTEDCLMNMVDDATTITYSKLFEEETTKAAMLTLWEWIEKYGIPLALYTDKFNVYIVNIKTKLEGEVQLTAFAKACKKLDIKIITANSPQAKGRVERNNGVYQDRFVKELKFQKIKDRKNANKLLQEKFCNELNEKFALKNIPPDFIT